MVEIITAVLLLATIAAFCYMAYDAVRRAK
jgi:hypothetical protein